VELCTYTGELWREAEAAPDLARLLERRNTLVELTHGAPPAAVVLGVPHHAPVGVDWIAEERPEGPRVADYNAALYALVCFERLRERDLPCRLLVAAHATDHDPNKIPDSPYCTQAMHESEIRLLLECHAASPDGPHDLELSAGHNPHARPLRFGRLLSRALGTGQRLAVQRASGSRAAQLFDTDGQIRESQLRYPALRTHSLAEAGERGIAALHLETVPRFRTQPDGGGALPDDGFRLGNALAEAIATYLDDAPR
jgi:hypothetical protein